MRVTPHCTRRQSVCRKQQNTKPMMVSIANPIYDSVFKYLMEDEFFSAIENRDTALMQKDKTIAEQKEQIRSMVKAMSDNGMSIEMISNITKIPLEEISKMTK